MSIYIPSTLIPEHESAEKSCKEYKDFCKIFKGPNMSNIDPATLDGTFQDDNEPIWANSAYNAMESLPAGRLKKLLKLWWATANLDHAYLKNAMNDSGEDILIRLYAICGLMGGNDEVKEDDIRNKEPWALGEADVASICDKFIELYNQASNDIKNDDLIMLEYMVCYCHKKRYLWYPLGDNAILDDICTFVRGFDAQHNSDIVKLRCDRELHLMAAWYRWAGLQDQSMSVSDEIINRPPYEYSLNPYKISARTEKAFVHIEKLEYADAAKMLMDNINEYGWMKTKGNFKSLNTHSYYENGLFLVYMMKTYDIMESITGRSFDTERSLLVRTRKGPRDKDKIKELDKHDYRHQWERFSDDLKSRMKHVGYINYSAL